MPNLEGHEENVKQLFRREDRVLHMSLFALLCLVNRDPKNCVAGSVCPMAFFLFSLRNCMHQETPGPGTATLPHM